METRKINKLKKRKAEILRQEYAMLSDEMRTKSWSRLANIDHQLKQLKAK